MAKGATNGRLDPLGYNTIRVEKGPEGSLPETAVFLEEVTLLLDGDPQPQGKQIENGYSLDIVGNRYFAVTRRVDLAHVHTEYILPSRLTSQGA